MNEPGTETDGRVADTLRALPDGEGEPYRPPPHSFELWQGGEMHICGVPTDGETREECLESVLDFVDSHTYEGEPDMHPGPVEVYEIRRVRVFPS